MLLGTWFWSRRRTAKARRFQGLSSASTVLLIEVGEKRHKILPSTNVREKIVSKMMRKKGRRSHPWGLHSGVKSSATFAKVPETPNLNLGTMNHQNAKQTVRGSVCSFCAPKNCRSEGRSNNLCCSAFTNKTTPISVSHQFSSNKTVSHLSSGLLTSFMSSQICHVRCKCFHFQILLLTLTLIPVEGGGSDLGTDSRIPRRLF